MSIVQIKVKFLGKTDIMYRILNNKGEVVQVFCTLSEAEDWISY